MLKLMLAATLMVLQLETVIAQSVNSPTIQGNNNNVNIRQTIINQRRESDKASPYLSEASALTQQLRETLNFYTEKEAERAGSQGEFQVAAAIYRKQIAESNASKVNLSGVYIKLSDHEVQYDPRLSVDTLKKGIDNYPENVELKVALARRYLQLGYTASALSVISENLPAVDKSGNSEASYLMRLISALAMAQDRDHELLLSMENRIVSSFNKLDFNKQKTHAEDHALALSAMLLAQVEMEGVSEVGALPVGNLKAHLERYYTPAENLYLRVGKGNIYLLLSSGQFATIANSQASSRVEPLEKQASDIGRVMQFIWRAGDVASSVRAQLQDALKEDSSIRRMQAAERSIQAALEKLPACHDCPIRLLAEVDIYAQLAKYYSQTGEPRLAYDSLRKSYHRVGRLIDANGHKRRLLALKSSVLAKIADVRDMLRKEEGIYLHFFPVEATYLDAVRFADEAKNGLKITYVGLTMRANILAQYAWEYSASDITAPFNLCLGSLASSRRVLSSLVYREAVFDAYRDCSLRVLIDLYILAQKDEERVDQLLNHASEFLSNVEKHRIPLSESQVTFKDGLALDLMSIYAKKASVAY